MARSFGGRQVQSDHLLFALLVYRESTAAKALEALGVSQSDVRDLHRVAEDGPQSKRGSGFSREAKRVLRRALERGEHRSGEVGTPDVLVALLEAGSGPAVNALRERGVTADAVRTEVARHPVVRRQGVASANPLPPETDLPSAGPEPS
jgi:ATP-dependent Clp protease ATP-binding subunit ClpA